MELFRKKQPYRTTSFSEFISGASSKEKKRVYADVLKLTTESQKGVIKAASKAKAEAAP
jgi:hypothetical protein